MGSPRTAETMFLQLGHFADMIIAPDSVGTYQDSDGGDGRKCSSPLFSIDQRRRLLIDLSCTLAWTIDIIASSKRTSHSSLSRGINSWIPNRSATDRRLSQACSNSLAISFIGGLRKPIPLVGGDRSFDRIDAKGPRNPRSRISRPHRSERLDGTSRPKTINTATLASSIFSPKNSISCPITPAELRVVRQSPPLGRG
jgi:hypothetical protein